MGVEQRGTERWNKTCIYAMMAIKTEKSGYGISYLENGVIKNIQFVNETDASAGVIIMWGLGLLSVMFMVHLLGTMSKKWVRMWMICMFAWENETWHVTGEPIPIRESNRGLWQNTVGNVIGTTTVLGQIQSCGKNNEKVFEIGFVSSEIYLHQRHEASHYWWTHPSWNTCTMKQHKFRMMAVK